MSLSPVKRQAVRLYHPNKTSHGAPISPLASRRASKPQPGMLSTPNTHGGHGEKSDLASTNERGESASPQQRQPAFSSSVLAQQQQDDDSNGGTPPPVPWSQYGKCRHTWHFGNWLLDLPKSSVGRFFRLVWPGWCQLQSSSQWSLLVCSLYIW